jgi:hypothetical protein
MIGLLPVERWLQRTNHIDHLVSSLHADPDETQPQAHSLLWLVVVQLKGPEALDVSEPAAERMLCFSKRPFEEQTSLAFFRRPSDHHEKIIAVPGSAFSSNKNMENINQNF